MINSTFQNWTAIVGPDLILGFFAWFIIFCFLATIVDYLKQ